MIVVGPVEAIAKIVVVGIQVVVDASLPECLTPLLGVQHFNAVGIHRGGNAAIEVDADFSVLTFLCSDDNHTISSTRTVDAGRSSIFQHLNRLDVVAIQFVHASLCGHTINNVEGVVVVQRTVTTNAYGGSSRGVTICRDVHSGNSTLKSFHGVVLVLLLQFVYIHNADCASEVGFALNLITGDDHFVEFVGVIGHGDVHSCGCWQFLRGKANVGDDERGARGSLQVEVAVDVGDSTVRRTFLHDGSADDGFAYVVDDGAAGFSLCKSKCACQKEEERQHQPAH